MNLSFKTFISGTVVVLASATAVSAMAQTPMAPADQTTGTPRGQGKGLKGLDTNNDRMISRDEAKGRPMLAKNFDAIDTNKDGQLSRDELKAFRKAHKGEGRGQYGAKS